MHTSRSLSLKNSWRNRNIQYELEILPLLVAVKIWSTNIVGKLVVHYLDNDAARSAYVRAHASTDLGAALIAEYVEFEYKCRFSPWFARVASHSNPSDEPSRMNFEATLAWASKQSRIGPARALVAVGNHRVL